MRAAGLMRSLVETTKPGITRLVTVTACVGFVLAVADATIPFAELAIALLGCALGTALSASGANALNQWWERARDARMERTRERPLPRGRAAPGQVLALGIAASIAGVGTLWAINGAAPAAVSAACVLIYVLLYTPLKPRTHWATLVGTLPGALPVLIGWSAGTGGSWASLSELGGLSLFALMTIWQIPHFMAIAWMYRDDYARGGFPMLAVIDSDGSRTARWVLLWTGMLLPATLAPVLALPEQLGVITIATALISGVGFSVLAVSFARLRDRASARSLFFASIAHLPLLWLVMVGEAVVRRFF